MLRSRSLGARLLPAMVAALASAAAVSGAAEFSGRPVAASGQVTLTDDSAGSAMFSAAGLAPGQTVSRCLTVSASAGGAPLQVRLYGAVSGGLAPDLEITVKAGSGGGYGSCAGFSGQVVYDGTLAGFGAQHVDYATGLVVWEPTVDGTSSYRFDATLQPQSSRQGQSATAVFTWEAQTTGPAPSPATPPAPQPTPSEAVPPAIVQEPTPGPSVVADSGAPSPVSVAPVGDGPSPSPSGAAGPTVRPTASPPTPDGPGARLEPLPSHPASSTASTPHDALDRLIDALPAPVATVARVFAPVVRKPGFPLLWVLLVVLFLVVQDRIDRSDPKLALAPVFAESDLPFPLPRERP